MMTKEEIQQCLENKTPIYWVPTKSRPRRAFIYVFQDYRGKLLIGTPRQFSLKRGVVVNSQHVYKTREEALLYYREEKKHRRKDYKEYKKMLALAKAVNLEEWFLGGCEMEALPFHVPFLGFGVF